MDGICTDCKEWTTLEDSCCGAGVWIEGKTYYPEDIEEEEEDNERE